MLTARLPSLHFSTPPLRCSQQTFLLLSPLDHNHPVWPDQLRASALQLWPFLEIWLRRSCIFDVKPDVSHAKPKAHRAKCKARWKPTLSGPVYTPKSPLANLLHPWIKMLSNLFAVSLHKPAPSGTDNASTSSLANWHSPTMLGRGPLCVSDSQTATLAVTRYWYLSHTLLLLPPQVKFSAVELV